MAENYSDPTANKAISVSDKVGVKKDCFAYRNSANGTCTALKMLYCKNEKCNFYKSKNRKM